jgi:enoyl-CoA hydratase/carnithine racemase
MLAATLRRTNKSVIFPTFTRALSAPKSYEMLTVEKKGKVNLVTLNRPKALNALCDKLISELNEVVTNMQSDSSVSVMVLTGSQKAFAAGADIREMSSRSFADVVKTDMFSQWDDISRSRKPIIAAVNGFALGGGCELAMMCDFIIAGSNAIFGQPEIRLGTIPGVGGTQRLTRAIGKSKAMEMILTGRNMTATEAETAGLVARVVDPEKTVQDALETAEKIASYSVPVVAMAKDCVNRAFESTLREGVNYERRIFHSTFATNDRKEGMAAFVEKRTPAFTDS